MGCKKSKDPWADDPTFPKSISFQENVLPILSTQCFSCHGPDEQAGEVRLDVASQLRTLSTGSSVYETALWQTLARKHPQPIPERDQAIVRRWLEIGATLPKHWALKPIPQRSEPPRLQPSELATSDEIIAFTQATLSRIPSLEERETYQAEPPTRAELLNSLLHHPLFSEGLKNRILLLTGASIPPEAPPFQPYLRWLDSTLGDSDASFQKFLTLALAGDRLPDAGQEGQLATAWLRLPRPPETTLAESVSASLLNLSAPNLPPPWKNLQDILNDLFPEQPSAGNEGAVHPPFVKLHTPRQITELASLRETHQAQRQELLTFSSFPEQDFENWRSADISQIKVPDLAAAFSFDESFAHNGALHRGGSWIATSTRLVPGIFGQAIAPPSTFTGIEINSATPFTLSFFLKIPALPSESQTILTTSQPEGRQSGFDIQLSSEGIRLRFTDGSPANGLSVSSSQLPSAGNWHHFAISYDGSRTADGFQAFLDLMSLPLTVQHDSLYGLAGNEEGTLRFIGPIVESSIPSALDELSLHQRVLSPTEIAQIRDGTSLVRALRDPTTPEPELVAHYLASTHTPYRALVSDIATTSHRIAQLESTALLVPIVAGSTTSARELTLSENQASSTSEPIDRLTFARWLFDPQNPVPARVLVNRFYVMMHGVSLFANPNDLTNHWTPPTDEALLDSLARELIDSDWNIRHLFKVILLNPPQ